MRFTVSTPADQVWRFTLSAAKARDIPPIKPEAASPAPADNCRNRRRPFPNLLTLLMVRSDRLRGAVLTWRSRWFGYLLRREDIFEKINRQLTTYVFRKFFYLSMAQ